MGSPSAVYVVGVECHCKFQFTIGIICFWIKKKQVKSLFFWLNNHYTI